MFPLACSGIPPQADRILRAYRLYLADFAISFEKSWIALHQMLSARPATGHGFEPREAHDRPTRSPATMCMPALGHAPAATAHYPVLYTFQ